jgi:hypothetical protein
MRRWAVFLLAALLVAACAAAAAGDGKGKRKGEVRVATTGSYSELIERLPITRRPGVEPRVAMSLGPGQMPKLRRGDEVELSSEVQVTLECNEREPRCLGDPYHYDPRLNVRLIAADSRRARRGKQLAGKSATCQQRRPREHHCVVTITGAELRVGKLNRLPCPAKRCFFNLVLDAHNPRASAGDVIVVGGVKPNGAIPQDRGRINSVLFRPANARYPRPRHSRARRINAIPLDLKRYVVYSQKLRRLERGDQLAATAEIFTKEAGLPFSVRTSTQLILAERPNAVKPGPLAKRIGGQGELTEANGFNCTRDKDVCVTRKAGVLRVRRSARRKGRFRPMFVNVVMVSGAKRVKPGGGDRYEVLRKGRLSVTRYPR